MSKVATFAALIFLGMAFPVMANPIVFGTGFAPPEIAGLLAEAVVVAALLARLRFDFIRLLYTWVPVTYVTYWLLGIFALGLMQALSVFGVDGEDFFTVIMLSGEVLVVFLEAWIIRRLSKAIFYRTPADLLSIRSAMLVSIVGNATSIIVAFAWLKVL